VPSPRVVVLDHGSGNLRSAERALAAAGADTVVSADPGDAQEADGLVVPGVGAFAACMAGLRSVGGREIIRRRLAGGRPVLGICVGMQVLFEIGDERGVRTEGCGEWPGIVDRLTAPVLPHMGWNTVTAAEGSALFAGVEHERFYFVHSNAARSWQASTPAAGNGTVSLPGPGRSAAAALTWAEHGEPFLAAVENGPLSATQFHPEKSGAAGARLLANWVRTLSG
jgi:imidazole glycerol phosphate synthase, glutamine amidotransferase subunit